MTPPRMVLPGATYLLTRRCVEGQHRLRPDEGVAELLEYCLARAATELGIAVHGATGMSNHWHAVVTDPSGVISEFARSVHSLEARCLNARYGDREAVWSSTNRLNLVRLCGPEAIFDKLVYTALNPVAAGLVARTRAWGGLALSPRDVLRTPRRSRRPAELRSEGGACPDEVTLAVVPPPGFEHLAPEAFVRQFEAAVAKREDEVRRAMKAEGRRFLGMAGVRALGRHSAPRRRPERNARIPSIACQDARQRVIELTRLVTFRQQYREAVARWLAGERDVVFPYGTYKMRGYPGVLLARPPDEARAAA